MENLQIKKTKYTMEVNFNEETGILEMTGSCYPENALNFFGPISQWIKTYIAERQKELLLNIRMDYVNTSSTKCLLDIFETFEAYHQKGGNVKINWYYAEDDEDILETGEELAEGMAFPIEFIPY